MRDILVLFSTCTVRLYTCSTFTTMYGQICNLLYLFFDQIIPDFNNDFVNFRLYFLHKVCCLCYSTISI